MYSLLETIAVTKETAEAPCPKLLSTHYTFNTSALVQLVKWQGCSKVATSFSSWQKSRHSQTLPKVKIMRIEAYLNQGPAVLQSWQKKALNREQSKKWSVKLCPKDSEMTHQRAKQRPDLNLSFNLRWFLNHFCLTLTIAWRSTCGFQSESYRITTSAVARLIPRPPARVLSINTNFELPGSLYALIEACKNNKCQPVVCRWRTANSILQNTYLSLIMRGLPIKPTIFIISPHTVIFQNI